MLVKILAFTYRNWIFAKRNLFTFFELLFWPVVSLVSMGLMSGFLKLDQNLLNFVLTGAITAGTIQVATLDVAYGLLYDVWSKSIKHTFLAPIEHFHFIIGSWLVGIIRGIIIFAFMAVFSYYAFGFEIPSYKIATIFMLGVFLNALIMGMVICFLITLYGQRVETAVTMGLRSVWRCGLVRRVLRSDSQSPGITVSQNKGAGRLPQRRWC